VSVLNRIVERTRAEVTARVNDEVFQRLEREVRPSDRSFADALRGPDLSLIAEFKPRSPSKGEIRPGARVASVAPLYARFACAMSVLCDAVDFGGGPHLLGEASVVCTLPLLYKGFVVSEAQVLEARVAGAHGILLMASVLDDATLAACHKRATELGMSPLVEVHSQEELDRVLPMAPAVIGVNRRDLHTLEFDTDRMFALLEQIPSGVVRVAESGFNTSEDVDAVRGRADAVLIGSAFMGASDIEAAIRGMGWHQK
jgi:indole-3-glycerol phosphate synthase